MTWEHVLAAFFIANLLGYGGGPSTIPLIQAETVGQFHLLSNQAFVNLLAVANALPGPVATKLAVAIGYQSGGLMEAALALLATVLPSAVALILLLRLLDRFRGSQVVTGLTLLVQPVIAVLMGRLTLELGFGSITTVGWVQTLCIAVVSALAIYRFRIHPAFVIAAAFAYGGLVLPHLAHV